MIFEKVSTETRGGWGSKNRPGLREGGIEILEGGNNEKAEIKRG